MYKKKVEDLRDKYFVLLIPLVSFFFFSYEKKKMQEKCEKKFSQFVDQIPAELKEIVDTRSVPGLDRGTGLGPLSIDYPPVGLSRTTATIVPHCFSL